MAGKSHVYAAVAGHFGRSEPGAVGVFRNPGGAGRWQHVLPGIEAFTVFVHPTDPALVFAGTADGVWRSTDHGATFERANFPGRNLQVWSLLADATDPRRIYAGASPVQVFCSNDEGETWRRLPSPAISERVKAPFAARVMRMTQHPTRPQEIYAALEINGVMRTDDGGETWIDCSDDLIRLSQQPHLASKIVSDSFAEGMLDGHAITISPTDPDIVLLACRLGLFQSSDRGLTWQDMEVGRFSPVSYGRDIKVAPRAPHTLFAALSVAASSHDGGVYRSRDSGKTWGRFDTVQVHGTIMSVAVSGRHDGEVYIGARFQGEIFGTSDDGASWFPLSLPEPVKDIYCVACT